MVLLVLTKTGWHDAKSHLRPGAALWINADVLADGEAASLRDAGYDVTVFSSPVDPHDRSSVETALRIIAEHHPTESIWLEVAAPQLLEAGAAAFQEARG